MLVRLDEGRLHDMKWRAREAFRPAGHGHTIEALARGLGADSYHALLAYTENYGGILWDGDDSKAIAFLAERGITIEHGALAEVVAVDVVEHEHI